ncbi:hypothetical protein ACIQXD_26025 [Streptomyces uncialis]|uniref:hypothetical protein n=1 Tax=Streptomyces uncialis TaxID=1048205 RepID=UPI00381F266D
MGTTALRGRRRVPVTVLRPVGARGGLLRRRGRTGRATPALPGGRRGDGGRELLRPGIAPVPLLGAVVTLLSGQARVTPVPLLRLLRLMPLLVRSLLVLRGLLILLAVLVLLVLLAVVLLLALLVMLLTLLMLILLVWRVFLVRLVRQVPPVPLRSLVTLRSLVAVVTLRALVPLRRLVTVRSLLAVPALLALLVLPGGGVGLRRVVAHGRRQERCASVGGEHDALTGLPCRGGMRVLALSALRHRELLRMGELRNRRFTLPGARTAVPRGSKWPPPRTSRNITTSLRNAVSPLPQPELTPGPGTEHLVRGD